MWELGMTDNFTIDRQGLLVLPDCLICVVEHKSCVVKVFVIRVENPHCWVRTQQWHRTDKWHYTGSGGLTCDVYTVFRGGLEHLKIETRLINERFVSVMGECVIVTLKVTWVVRRARHGGSGTHTVMLWKLNSWNFKETVSLPMNYYCLLLLIMKRQSER